MTEKQNKERVYRRFQKTAGFDPPETCGILPDFTDFFEEDPCLTPGGSSESLRGSKSREEVMPREPQAERVLLLGLTSHRVKGQLSPEASLCELSRLAETAGGIVAERLLLKRERPDPAHYVGKGKLEELNRLTAEKEIDLLIIDDELSVRQQLQLDSRLEVPVIDRAALILQIFADHAQTKEGKLQVELAQLSYLLPRLTGKGKYLSRLGGGIGTRGPGETQLEKDRRHIRRRIESLKKEIQGIRRQRATVRGRRQKNPMPVLALVGYTNAGKSTLLNRLTDSRVLAEDKLFATLDPATRYCSLGGARVLLTDTVGFIQQLPHSLITAFRATLEEARYSDLLLLVTDASDPEAAAQLRTVQKVLEEIGCQDKKILYVFNKLDRVADPLELRGFLSEYQPAVLISAAAGQGLAELKQLVTENLPQPPVPVRFCLSQRDGGLLSLFYREGAVEEVEYGGEEIRGRALLPKALADKYQEVINLEEEKR